jgi:hypothetical protein
MKYKVGDEVKVRNDLIVDRCYNGFYFNKDMARWRGQIVTISEVENKDPCYRIKEDEGEYKWGWVDEMFEDTVENKKYKVGDKVKIREDLINGEEYGGIDYVSDMDKWKGKVVTISFADNDANNDCDCYGIAEDTEAWNWSAEMFEDVSDSDIPTDGKVQTVDVGYYLAFCGHRLLVDVYQDGVHDGKSIFTSADGFNQYLLPKDAIKWIVPHEREIDL